MERNKLLDSYATLEEYIGRSALSGKQIDKHQERGYYRFIPLTTAYFCELMDEVDKLTKPRNAVPKFLDIGCGVGTKVVLAERWFSAFGLEINPGYARIARKVFNSSWGHRIIRGNALTFKRYAEFDILYFYCPLRNGSMEKAFEQRLAREAKPGAIVIACNSQCNDWWAKDSGFKLVAHSCIYQKQ